MKSAAVTRLDQYQKNNTVTDEQMAQHIGQDKNQLAHTGQVTHGVCSRLAELPAQREEQQRTDIKHQATQDVEFFETFMLHIAPELDDESMPLWDQAKQKLASLRSMIKSI